MTESKSFDLKSAGVLFSKEISQYKVDLLILAILAIAIGIVSYINAQQLPDALLNDFYALDVWFGSDVPNVFGNMTSLRSEFGRNNKHPLFPIIAFPMVFVLGKLFQLDSLTATRLSISLIASLWICSLYVIFRLIGCPRLDTLLFSLLGGVSAASIFWFVVPESFSFGSLTILIGLIFAVLVQNYKFSIFWHIVVGTITMSVTITNWMVSLLTTIVNFRWKKALKITALTLIVVNVLWVFQRVIFVNTGFPFQPRTFIGEKEFMAEAGKSSVLSAISSFFYQTIVMPGVQYGEYALRPAWTKMTVNPLAPWSGSFWGAIAVVAWTGLLGLGIWSFFSTKQHSKFRLILGLTILGQLLMHSIYGAGIGETFIYSLHFAPLLLIVAAFSTLTRFRLVGLALVSLLIVSAGINNQLQLNQVTKTLLTYGTPSQQVEGQMRLRPSDPWSRSVGHVVLATPGSEAEAKAYYEPGGSFSPSVGSFGVSIWIVDKNGTLQTTSDAIPLSQIQQNFVHSANGQIPEIETKTEYYQASWSSTQSGNWQLNLQSSNNQPTKPVVVLRSIGPAGGSIHDLNWDGRRLLINNRWIVRGSPELARVYLGSETNAGWMTQKPTVTEWKDTKGWGYARLELGSGNDWTLSIEDTVPAPPPNLKTGEVLVKPVLDLPDAQFVDSFNAQISHLLMGLVGNRTRPSDPIEYTLPRSRNGAYQMVALARAGQLEVAKQLSTYFAENDFFNSIEPEADIPAIGIWALSAVAEAVNDSTYDQLIFPHVRRKAELILEMLSTNRPGYPVATKSLFPFSEHPDFLRVELIAGVVANSPGVISIDSAANIMSYRALLDAATLAERINQSADAQRWRSQAEQLQQTWQKSFKSKFASLDATYTSGLWPSGIVNSIQSEFAEGLQARWDESRDDRGALRQPPPDPYSTLAETHQWLLLGKHDQVWSTLQWFWANQSSPGLYTWWGINEEPDGILVPKNFSHWHRFRGWINPPHITPHYWSAAEMALLQLDMLAYVDRETNTLVLGAGIPEQWLNQPMSIKGLLAGSSLVDWSWDGKQMNVQINGSKMNVKLGSTFPANTPVRVTMLNKSTNAIVNRAK